MTLNVSRFHIVGLLLGVALIAGGWYLVDFIGKKNETIAQLKSELQDTKGDLVDANIKVSSLRGEAANLEQEKQQLGFELETSEIAGQYIASLADEGMGLFNEVGVSLAEFSDTSSDFVEWLTDRCLFAEPERSQASLLYGNWSAQRKKTTDDIDKLGSEIEELFNRF